MHDRTIGSSRTRDPTAASVPPDGRTGPRRPPAVVLGGGETALPVARSLGRAGIGVEAAGEHGDLVSYSRYCDAFGGVGIDEGRWWAWLARRAAEGPRVLLPCSDEAVEFTARHRDVLQAGGYRLYAFEPSIALAMLDKGETYRRAASGGFPLPRWRTLRPGEGDGERIGDMPLPCAVKPVHRHRYQALTGRQDKLIVAASPLQLSATVDELLAHQLDVMVTEIVPGPDSSLWSYHTFVDDYGECVGGMTVRKLRQEPIHFGVASLAVAEWNAEVADFAEALVRHLRVRGPVEVEVKRDAATGELKLIECNHRLNFLLELVHRSGYELTRLTYARAAGLADPPQGRMRWGARLWHPVRDLRAFRAYRREGELSATEWLASIAHRNVCSTVSDRRDAAPGLVAASRLLSARVRRGGRALTRPSNRRRTLVETIRHVDSG